jgi:metal-responsive CopG/Arc/MetJ family transcriptional regulator
MPPDLIKRLDGFCELTQKPDTEHPTRSEAVRMLVEDALARFEEAAGVERVTAAVTRASTKRAKIEAAHRNDRQLLTMLFLRRR